MIIGHRAVGVAETSLEDFQEALNIGLEMIEFDLRMTQEGELVVFHGPPGMEGIPILSQKTMSDLQKSTGRVPPRFADVVDLCQGKILFDIEIKEHGILDSVFDILGQKGEEHIITSFLDPVVFEAKAAGMKAGLILGIYRASAKRRLSEIFPSKRKKESGADFLLPERRILQASPWKKPFFNCIVWGVNEKDDMKKLLSNPRIQGIITDHPRRALKIEAKGKR